MTDTELDKSKQKIESMFDEIAPTYDRLNHFFTLNIDTKWRREIVKNIIKNNYTTSNILDLATGTGDLTAELVRLNADKICAVDISKNMLEIQRMKIRDSRLELIQADVKSLPFEKDTFNIVTIGFGVRNFEYLEESLKEIRRVMKTSGRLIILEMFRCGGIKTNMFNLYFGKIMPLIGNKVSGSKYAYSYLFKSVNNFLTVPEFINLCKGCGFETEYYKNNFFGIVNTVYLKAI
ncbi:MAG TPA: ubiquinone/menaquinone biosynthesis methyltransferase [Ignavibacteria bacterium]|nr:ubiquinone/menaquinone biosynthesis methyltransferase [Ignavibacteria bacterium]